VRRGAGASGGAAGRLARQKMQGWGVWGQGRLSRAMSGAAQASSPCTAARPHYNCPPAAAQAAAYLSIPLDNVIK